MANSITVKITTDNIYLASQFANSIEKHKDFIFAEPYTNSKKKKKGGFEYEFTFKLLPLNGVTSDGIPLPDRLGNNDMFEVAIL